MQIVLVTNDRNLKEYRNRELADRLERRGAVLIPLAPGSESVVAEAGRIVLACQDQVIQPDLVVNGLTSKTGKGLYLVRLLEAAGFRVVNRAEPWYWAKYKPIATVGLVVRDIPHPPTLFAGTYSPSTTVLARRLNKRRLVLKPWNGALGQGVIRVRNDKSLSLRLRRWYNRHGTIYAQSYIRSARRRDIRALVIGNQVFGATYRYAPRGHWKTNVAAGGKPANCPVTPEITKLSLQATRALGLDYAGVDLIEGRRGLQVLEVNAWPNYHVYDQVVGIDIADRLAQYLCAQIR